MSSPLHAVVMAAGEGRRMGQPKALVRDPDGTSWLNFFPAGRRTNHPLLFDRDHLPKPAFKAVLDAIAAP